MLALGVVLVMAVSIHTVLRAILGPEELPSAFNLLLAGLFPSWEFVGRLEVRRRSRGGPSMFKSVVAGVICVLATLLVSIVLEGCLQLLRHGELRVRFEYTALLPFLYVFVATAPVGVLVGVLSELLLRVVTGGAGDAGMTG